MTFDGKLAGMGIGSIPTRDIVKNAEYTANGNPEIWTISQIPGSGIDMYDQTMARIPSVVVGDKNNDAYIDLASEEAGEKFEKWQTLLESDDPNGFSGKIHEHLPLYVVQRAIGVGDEISEYDGCDEFFKENILNDVSKDYNREIINPMTNKPYRRCGVKYCLTETTTLGMDIIENLSNRQIGNENLSLRELLIKSVNLHARWMENELEKFGLDYQIISFDNPSLGRVKPFEKPIGSEDVLEIMNKTMAGLGDKTYVMAHSCDIGTDWGMFKETNYDIIHIDVIIDKGVEKFKSKQHQLLELLKQGKTLALGLVPNTSNDYYCYDEKFVKELGFEYEKDDTELRKKRRIFYWERPESEQRAIDEKYIQMSSDIFRDLVNHFEEAVSIQGEESRIMEPKEVREAFKRSLISTGCGFGSNPEKYDEHISDTKRGYGYLRAVSETLRQEFGIEGEPGPVASV